MKKPLLYKFNLEKNKCLKAERHISFEDIIEAIEQGALLDAKPHPDQARYPTQEIFIVEIQGYAYVVPYVQEGNTIFLKTIFPSRKANKQYLKQP